MSMGIDMLVKAAPGVLPVLLLGLSFIVKLSIERTVDLPKATMSIIELPTDMMFLSSSLIVAYIISNPSNAIYGLLLLLLCIVLSIFVILLWRKTEYLYAKKSWWALLTSMSGFLVSIPAVFFTVYLNIPAEV